LEEELEYVATAEKFLTILKALQQASDHIVQKYAVTVINKKEKS
jgi:hypothetical protein